MTRLKNTDLHVYKRKSWGHIFGSSHTAGSIAIIVKIADNTRKKSVSSTTYSHKTSSKFKGRQDKIQCTAPNDLKNHLGKIIF